MIKQTFEQFPEQIWVTAVPVATVWTAPESAREIDAAGVDASADVETWISQLNYEENLALCTENRVQSQLLYGEPVLVTETREGWAHVVIPSQASHKDSRGYPGWVPLAQLKQVDATDWHSEQHAAVTEKHTWLENEEGEHLAKLSYMTILPVAGKKGDRVEVKTPQGTQYIKQDAVHIFPAEETGKHGDGQDIIAAAEKFLGLDYFWGGMSAFGYDCSGLSYAAHKANGYRIARDADDQAGSGREVALDELKPGDLLFFAYDEGKGRLHHVGIYYGDGKLLHAPQTGRGVELIPMAGTKYEKELCGARRYWKQTEEKPS
ncbi:NlpC/P60 family protein [Lentibacillus sediminis]|uniref:C40 family peptidase n=1 Tax=Lentibacillus sediminis TaxID=1940529 RepID=UPI000C1BAD18|nr:C40 family peptidase [Lentibacillus sediminis]